MKIAMFCETYMPHINGVVTHIKLLKEGLEALGHEVLIVTAEPSLKKHYVENSVLYCPAYRSKKLYGFGVATPYSKTRYKMVKEFNPDICHIHQEFGIGYFGAKYAEEENIPLIYTMHTMYDDYLYYIFPKLLTPIAKKILYSYSKLLSKKSTEITGPSAKIENYFEKIGVNKEINIIPNSVEVDKFNKKNIDKDAIAKIREKYGIAAEKSVSAFVGRLGDEKSIDVLLENFAKEASENDNIHLLIIGSGPSKKELKEQAKKLNISSMVTFTGQISHEELPPYLAIASSYITASLSEVYSISMLEGMAMGLPIIQRYDELNKDQIIEGENGFIFKDSTEMIKILRSIRDMEEKDYQKLATSTRQSVIKAGSAEMAKKIESIYELAIAKKENEATSHSFKVEYGA